MSGLSGNCYCIKSLLLLGSNLSDQDDLAKRLEPILLSPSDREGALANILYLIQLCPNDHAAVLARSLEHFHRLVEVYRICVCVNHLIPRAESV
jgi:hypothetical protein